MQNNEITPVLADCADWCENMQVVFDQARSLQRRMTNELVTNFLNLLNVQDTGGGVLGVFVGNPGYQLDLNDYPAIQIDPAGNVRVFGLLISEINSMTATMAALVSMADAAAVATAAYGAFVDRAATMRAYT